MEQHNTPTIFQLLLTLLNARSIYFIPIPSRISITKPLLSDLRQLSLLLGRRQHIAGIKPNSTKLRFAHTQIHHTHTLTHVAHIRNRSSTNPLAFKIHLERFSPTLHTDDANPSWMESDISSHYCMCSVNG